MLTASNLLLRSRYGRAGVKKTGHKKSNQNNNKYSTKYVNLSQTDPNIRALLSLYELEQGKSIQLHCDILNAQSEIEKIQIKIVELLQQYSEYPTPSLHTIHVTPPSNREKIPTTPSLHSLVTTSETPQFYRNHDLNQLQNEFSPFSPLLSQISRNDGNIPSMGKYSKLSPLEQLDSLARCIKRYKTRFDAVSGNKEALNHEIVLIENQLAAVIDENSKLHLQIQQLTKNIQIQDGLKNEELCNLKEKLISREKEYQQGLKDLTENYSGQILQLNHAKDVSNKVIGNQRDRIEQLELKNENLVNENQKLIEMNQSLQNDKNIVFEHASTLEKQLDFESTAKQTYIDQISSLEQRLSTQTDIISTLQTKLIDMAHEQGQSDQQYLVKIATLEDQISELKSANQTLTENLNKPVNNNQKLDQNSADSPMSLLKQSHLQELSHLRTQHEETIIMYRNNQDKLLAQITSLVMSKTTQQQHLDDLTLQLDGYKHKYTDLAQQEIEYQGRIEELLNVIRIKEGGSDTLQRSYNILREKVIQFEAWYDNKDNLIVLTKDLETKLAEANIQIVEKKIQLDDLNMTMFVLKENLNNLNQNLKEQNDKVNILQNQLTQYQSLYGTTGIGSIEIGGTDTPNKALSMTRHKSAKMVHNTPSVYNTPSKQPLQHLNSTIQPSPAVLPYTPGQKQGGVKSENVIQNQHKTNMGMYLKPMVPTFGSTSNVAPRSSQFDENGQTPAVRPNKRL